MIASTELDYMYICLQMNMYIYTTYIYELR